MSKVNGVLKFRDEINHLAEDDLSGENFHDIRLIMDAIVYFELTVENRAAVVNAWDKIRDRIEPVASRVILDDDGRFKKYQKKHGDLLAFWMDGSSVERELYGFQIYDGKGSEVPETSFTFYSSDLSPAWIRWTLSVESGFSDLNGFKESALSMIHDLDFLSGSAGLSLNIKPGFPGWVEGGHIAKIASRFIGIDGLDEPHMLASFFRKNLKTPNWLTFVGEQFSRKFLNQREILASMPETVSMRQIPKGLSLQAGCEPSLGYVNLKDEVSDYRFVWRLIKSQAIDSTVFGQYDGIGGSDNTRRWFQRFDKDKA